MLSVAHIDKNHSRLELPECFSRASQAGFDGVEIVIGSDRTCEWFEPEENCRTIASDARRGGIRLLSAALADEPAVHIGVLDAPQRAKALERVRAVAQRCQCLGAQVLRLVPGKAGVASGGIRQPYQDALNATRDSLEALRFDFERCGVVAALMPCHHGLLLSPPEFRELIDRVNSPVVGAALDWSACATIGDPADWIATLQGRLAALSIDASARTEPTWNRTILPALRDAGFDGMLIHTDAAGNTG